MINPYPINVHEIGFRCFPITGKPVELNRQVHGSWREFLIVTGMEPRFAVTYDGEPLPGQEVTVGYQGQRIKTLNTDKQGQVTVSFPWDKQYVFETIHTEESAGTFQGDDYEAIRHTATFSIPPAAQ